MNKLDLKLYRGYVNDNQLVVYGHVFRSNAPDKFRLDRKGFRHAFSIFHMYRIKPITNINVLLNFKEIQVNTKTLSDGYFRFTIPFDFFLVSGWHKYQVSCTYKNLNIVRKGELLKPHISSYGIISDIDDTFLISHSNNFFKKIYILLLKNIHKRKVFEDVVEHYKALSSFGHQQDSFNSFFYVSNSEWNLYEFINDFAKIHQLPKAIIKLKKIKAGLGSFLFSGSGYSNHKFEKIKDIIGFYPNIKYVLLGDDSQKDVFVYERIVKIFPLSIKAVYIRQTGIKQKPSIKTSLQTIESLQIATMYFKNSKEAIAHSKSIGLI
ncbi:MAG: hypothetical protein AUK33_01775 [Flavobacteriaceae bacterium CG2_30_34_30]|nr:MAG: hypothetical protein AUK33_01775 [Flavobacteriaceae bacterium CG2_30_34_30]PIQ17960.1 MAG: hypothetical protein COW66_09005 [Flavobacteriaceae bacterium CG18_big_fil_WC_8_21_14_2_50_34_36]